MRGTFHPVSPANALFEANIPGHSANRESGPARPAQASDALPAVWVPQSAVSLFRAERGKWNLLEALHRYLGRVGDSVGSFEEDRPRI